MDGRELIGRVDPDRLAQLALALVQIPSPTGQTRAAAEHYAAHLAGLGLAVELIRDWPEAPAVIARLEGGSPGPILTLSGHLDHVPMPHDPPLLAGGVLHGRGAADMKGALACAAEAMRVLKESGVPLRGRLQIIAHGHHEWPGGVSADLAELCRRGLAGGPADAAIVCELGKETLPIAQRGMAWFRIRLTRSGPPAIHELRVRPGTPSPAFAAGRVLTALERAAARLAGNIHELTGPETLFIGQVHAGETFNMLSQEATIEGSMRWSPDRSGHQARAQLERLIRGAVRGIGVETQLEWRVVRESCCTDPQAPVVQAVREACRAISGQEPPLAASAVVADASVLARAGIPTVYHGPQGRGLHGPHESIAVAELVRATQVFILAALRLSGR